MRHVQRPDLDGDAAVAQGKRRTYVQIPTADGRELHLTRYTQPESDLKLLLDKLRITLPPQAPPKITAAQAATATPL